MKKSTKVSMTVVRRLPKYYRYLGDLRKKGITRVSSQELSKLTGFTASQIRQDLNNYGGFGQQGYGYNVEELRDQLGKIIGLELEYNAIVVGAGNLGQAIVTYRGLEGSSFKILSIFDKEEELFGTKIKGIEVRDVDVMKDFIKENNVDIGIITSPKENAQEITDILIDSEISGIWNFTQADLKVPESVIVENVRLNESLFILSYYLNNKHDYHYKPKV